MAWLTSLAATILAGLTLAGPGVAGLSGSLPPPPPPPAAEAGYRLNTFSSTAFTPSTVDLGQTGKSGFQWRLFNFFHVSPRADAVTLNADRTATVRNIFGNATLVSAAQIGPGPSFVGAAFGGGGYFEAEFAFDPAKVDLSKGVPAWWSMALEHMVDLPDVEWAGQGRGYEHFIEVDALEYNRPNRSENGYGGAVHEWYGVHDVTCSPYCHVGSSFSASQMTAPPLTNWTRYHRIAMLWIPATSTRAGSISFYFDGKKSGPAVRYAQFDGQPPPPGLQRPWTYGIIDRQHLVLILGSGSAPMRVRSVHVWQASAAGNLVH